MISERGEVSPSVSVPASLVTATEKKPALTRPSSSTSEPSYGACSSDSQTDFQCEMKGLRLIDLESLLASVSRRASCNVSCSPLTVRKDLKMRKGICTRLSLSYTNSLCTESDDAFCDPSKQSKAFNSRSSREDVWQRMCWAGGHLWVLGLASPINLQSLLRI